MTLIETLSGKHLLSVNLQPDESYFCEAMEPDAMDRLDEVLKNFHPDDAEQIEIAIRENMMDCDCEVCKKYILVLRRLQDMCRLMEEL